MKPSPSVVGPEERDASFSVTGPSFRTSPVFIEVPEDPGEDTTPPSTPGNLAADVLPDGTIDVSWTASTLR